MKKYKYINQGIRLLAFFLLFSISITSINIKATEADISSENKEEQLAKTYCFLGSSVTLGSLNKYVSFVEFMSDDYPEWKLIKEGAGGTTLVDLDERSYIQRMLNNIATDETLDHFVCQLSTNDASKDLPLGEISDSKELDSFDTSTIIGGMEYIIAYAQATWNCPVSFFTGPDFGDEKYSEMVDITYQLKDKWGIGIIDFYNYANMEALPKEVLESYMRKDLIHPLDSGYKWMADEISKYLIAYDLVAGFENALTKLPEKLVLEDEESVVNLRKAYDDLTNYERYMLSDAAVELLESAENQLMELKRIEEERLKNEMIRNMVIGVILGLVAIIIIILLGLRRKKNKSKASY